LAPLAPVLQILEYLILNHRVAFGLHWDIAQQNLAFFAPAPESDSDRREPENSDYHELENLIFNQRHPNGFGCPQRNVQDD
jgi:hypothetical protein